MSSPVIVLHGNDATGKTTLCKAIRDAGYTCYTRGDADPSIEVGIKTVDQYTLKIPSDDRTLPKTCTDASGDLRTIVRVILDAEIPILQQRIAKRPSQDEWESEKALFYFRTRFKELAAFFGIPLVRTDTQDIKSVVDEILTYARRPELIEMLETFSLRRLTLQGIEELVSLNFKDPQVDYKQRLDEIVQAECGPDSIFTPQDVSDQCARDPKLMLSIVNSYDKIVPVKPFSLRLEVEGESKQVYSVHTTLTSYFDDKLFVVLKGTIYSHSKQSTAEIEGLPRIRATGSRLFLEMLHRSGVQHTYEGLNEHGIALVSRVTPTPIETVFKARCEGTDKHSFFGMRQHPDVTLVDTGEYRSGPYVRFDWRNPNHVYKGVSPTTHPFYFLMEASLGKEPFYAEYLTKRAVPVGDKCVPEELVHGVQDVENSIDFTIRVFFTLQHYLNQIGLEVQDGCIMVDRAGQAMWSEINQDCMRIKRLTTLSDGTGEAFDKDMWRAGGSSAKNAIVGKWTQLNDFLASHLSSKPFHKNEMLSAGEPYGAVAKRVLNDSRLRLTPRYRALYERLAAHSRIPAKSLLVQAMPTIVPQSSRSLPLVKVLEDCWKLIAASPSLSTKKSADLIRHVLEHAKSSGITAEDLARELSTTRTPASAPPHPKENWTVAITASKYGDKTDSFVQDSLGIRVSRQSDRSLKISYEVVDKAKYQLYFGDLPVSFISMKPKDMPVLIATGVIDFAVTYNTVMDNIFPDARLVTSQIDNDVHLALIKRKGATIDPSTWSPDNKARIVSEHGLFVRQYLTERLGLSEEAFTLERVLGSSESFLASDPTEVFLLCDAVVSSGRTMEANGLETWKKIKEVGELTVGLYARPVAGDA